MAILLYKFTENNYIVHLPCVDFTACKFYLNQAA